MKKINQFLLCALFTAPCGAWAAGGSTGFNMAAQLLSAARNGNTRLVQNLINSGADVNYVDSTGVSVVCTAVMNNDMRAVQILQMYGADASNCDRQIKNYKNRTSPAPDSGLFAGLSSTHKLVLGTVGVAAVVGGLLWATDAFDDGDSNTYNGGTGSHAGGDSSESGDDSTTGTLIVPSSPSGSITANEWVTSAQGSTNFNYLRGLTITDPDYMQNYLLISHGYNLFANQYYGQTIFRNSSTHVPIPLSITGVVVGGGAPAIVSLITANGINVTTGGTALDRAGGISYVQGPTVSDASNVLHIDKYWNYTNPGCNGQECTGTDENESFDLSGNGTAVESALATNRDNNIAKIIAGWGASGDLYGFVPYGSLAVYRTGGGKDDSDSGIPFYNYQAMYNALLRNYEVFSGVVVKTDVIANASLVPSSLSSSTYDIISGVTDVDAFQTLVDTWYGMGQGDVAGDLFSLYNNSSPIIINSVGGYNKANYAAGTNVEATFENYVPALYGNINKNFMSVVAVQHETGTSSATSVNAYGDGTGAAYGKIRLSEWTDESDDTITYRSRICGVAGRGTGSIDPWCFAAPGDTAEYAVAALAGSVAALQKAFSYMSNQQIFNLLALTADGAYLAKNSSGNWYTTDELVAYLKTKYTMSAQEDALTGEDYLYAFKNTFGYGLINLERATTPGNTVYYYSNGNILSGGNLYWQSMRGSSVFGMRTATLPMSFYDVLTDIDNTVSVPRVWNMELSLGNDVSHGLYMGDTLAELKTHDQDNTVSIGNLTFGFARSERAYDDNMSGVDDMSLAYDNNRFGFRADYQHYLTDGAGRFSGLANPVLALASNAMTSNLVLHNGRLSISGRGFVGTVTSEGLLENDPAVSAAFVAAKLGDVMGADTGIKFSGERLSIASNVGTMRESNTVLGAMWDGLLNSNGADTNYIDSVLSYKVSDDIGLTLRGTYAWTRANDIANGVINGLSELKSNSFAAAVRVGNFDLVVSMPLALTRGEMYYSYANFGVNENNELLINNAGEYAIDLTPDVREYRFNASYKHKFGDWTDGALGFIYRVNPNNTDAFGNESIFMMKLSHRLGI